MHEVDLTDQYDSIIQTFVHKIYITIKSFSANGRPDTISRIAKLYIYLY